MNLNIELSDDLGAVVKAQAQAQGISPDRYVTRVLENILGPTLEQPQSGDGIWHVGEVRARAIG
jgi:hypothetical protein